jgi:serine protease
MGRARVFFSVAAVIAALATLATIGTRAQTTGAQRLDIREGVGLPAVDEGVLWGERRAPGSLEAARRLALHSVLRTDAVRSSGRVYKRGRVLVKFKDEVSASARAAALALASPTARIGERPSYANFDIVNVDPNEDAEATAQALANRPEVEYAQPAYRINTQFVPNDPLYASSPAFPPGQWNLPLIGLEAAWDIQPQAGSTITVAVLDTGMAYTNATVRMTIGPYTDDDGTHYPALGPVTLPYSLATQLVSSGRIVAPHDFIWDTNQPLDFDGHGTHVAGTIGQLTNDGIGLAGVAFNVKLMPVKVVNAVWDDIFGSPNFGSDAEVARGIRYAADNGAKVINMSIGRTGPPNTAPAVEDAIRYAVGKGCVVVIAGGNGFEDGSPREVYAEIASRVPGAIAVAAVDRNATSGDHRCTGGASSPSCHAYYSSAGSWNELAAPGGSFRQSGNNGLVYQQTFDPNFTDTFLLPVSQYRPPRFDMIAYVGYQGTSMATPHVSGVAAMLIQQGITDPAAVEAALERFALDLGAPGRDDLYGFGLVDARASLRGLGIAR